MHAESEADRLRQAFRQPTQVVTDFGHSQSYERTEEWVRPLLSRVPISRVTNVTPIDGEVVLPIWSATTPLARDLTVHAGKGRTSAASRVSAIMEAIERVCAEELPDRRVAARSYNELVADEGHDVVLDPELCHLPFDTTYHADKQISWTVGLDLLADTYVWIARDLVISPPRDGVCLGVETTGLASGNTLVEAALHALYELVERDAVATESFTYMHCEATDADAAELRLIDPDTVGGTPRLLIAELSGCALRVRIQELTNELGIPVFGALVIDEQFPGAEGDLVSFAGYGADLDPERALVRALMEAAQGHAIVMLGARDTFEGTTALPDRTAMLLRRAALHHSGNLVPFPRRVYQSGSPGDQLKIVSARLRACGITRIAVVDLTREDLEIPVVRLIVPGLDLPYGASSRRPGARLLRQIV